MNNHEVISAFLDERAFELPELAAALEHAEGRAVLIDVLALRRLVQPTDPVPRVPSAPVRWWSRLPPAIAAAAVVVALLGGYLLGLRRVAIVAESAAPAPTRVVQITSTSEDLPPGARR